MRFPSSFELQTVVLCSNCTFGLCDEHYGQLAKALSWVAARGELWKLGETTAKDILAQFFTRRDKVKLELYATDLNDLPEDAESEASVFYVSAYSPSKQFREQFVLYFLYFREGRTCHYQTLERLPGMGRRNDYYLTQNGKRFSSS